MIRESDFLFKQRFQTFQTKLDRKFLRRSRWWSKKEVLYRSSVTYEPLTINFLRSKPYQYSFMMSDCSLMPDKVVLNINQLFTLDKKQCDYVDKKIMILIIDNEKVTNLLKTDLKYMGYEEIYSEPVIRKGVLFRYFRFESLTDIYKTDFTEKDKI